jgi:hypothetical protein
MKCLYSLLMIFIISCCSASVKNYEIQKTTLCEQDSVYNKLKELYVKYFNSDSYSKLQPIEKRFRQKIHFLDNQSEITRLNSIDTWLNDNLNKTEYGTLAEAKADYAEVSKAIAACSKENVEYYEMLINILSTEGGAEIWKKVVEDTATQYAEKFDSDPLTITRKKLLKH